MTFSVFTNYSSGLTIRKLNLRQLSKGFKSRYLQDPSFSRLINTTTAKTPDPRPPASEVLTCHLTDNPPWTSYFVKYSSIQDDQWGRSSFNWDIHGTNYRILRTGCYPYIKYHCTQGPAHDLSIEDKFFRFIKVFNLGIPCLLYGIAAIFQIRHTEIVHTSKGPVKIYFLYKENKGSMY